MDSDRESVTPRRRRGYSCPQLVVGASEVAAFDRSVVGVSRQPGKKVLREAFDQEDFVCRKRRGVLVRSDYVIDVCLSSWSRRCPFL